MPRKRNKKYNTNNGRAEGQTQISISLPQELVDKIDHLAELENRNRSNFIVSALSDLKGGKKTVKKK